MSVRFDRFVFHADRRQLRRDDGEVHLTPKAFDLLALLIARRPAVVAKGELHKQLWPDTFVSDATLVGLIKELRRALNDHGGTFIRTAHRVGYAFAAAIEPETDRSPSTTCWLVAGTRRFALQNGINVIGRDPETDVMIDVAGVSRRHAQIVVSQGAATIEDLGSKNGTLVADRPVRGRVVLRNADRIQLATELLVFQMSGRDVSTETQPARSEGPESDT